MNEVKKHKQEKLSTKIQKAVFGKLFQCIDELEVEILKEVAEIKKS